MKNCWSSILIFNMDVHFFCSDANWNTSEVKNFLHKIAFCILNCSLTFYCDIISICNLHNQLLIFRFWTFWSKGNYACCEFSRLNFIFSWRWLIYTWFGSLPSEFCFCISIICNSELFCHSHIEIIIWESKLENLSLNFKWNWVSLSSHKEFELMYIIYEICDYSFKLLHFITTKYDIKTGFLSRGNNLWYRCRKLQFSVLDDHLYPNVLS